MSVTIVALVLIAFAGVAVGWLLASARKGGEAQRMLAEREAATQAREAAVQERVRHDAALAQRALAERDLAVAERQKSEQSAAEARALADAALQARAVAETRLAEMQRLVGEQAGFIDSSKKQLEESFAAAAQKTLESISESFLKQNRLHLEGSKDALHGALETKRAEVDGLLKPLSDMLAQYRGELQKSELDRNAVYGGLQEQIRSLLIAQESTQREASRLANALQSPTVRGSWGENSLKRCVELAGMSEFCDFEVQMTFESEEGKRLRPDLIVRLPNNRVIAVDSKVPLSDYTLASNEQDEAAKRELLSQHARTVKRHIESLSRREYQASIGDTLDFVILFMPGEHFLSAALIADPTVFDYAADRKIFLASPTVLLPLLRAVSAGWKAERTEENAKKMHDAGVELFNRFVRVMDLISEVGGRLAKTVEKYNEAVKSIDSRLWPKGEEMQRMAGSGKTLNAPDQVEAIPLESSKLRLRSQSEEEGELIPFRDDAPRT